MSIADQFPNSASEQLRRELAQLREKAAKYDAMRPVFLEMQTALQNVGYYDYRISPPPYGHNCRWCGDCHKRMHEEYRAALKHAEEIGGKL